MTIQRTHTRSVIGPFIITVGIQRDDVGGVQDLHRQPLLRCVVVALDADAAEPRVLECFLKRGREVFLISCTRGEATPAARATRLHQLKASSHLFLFLFCSASEGPGSRRAFNQTPQNRGQSVARFNQYQSAGFRAKLNCPPALAEHTWWEIFSR